MYPTDELDPYLPPPQPVLKRTLGKRSPAGTLTDVVQTGEGTDPITRYRSRGADLYGQAEAMMNQEPDMSVLKQYAKQRSQQGDSAMLNAMAASFAGDRFKPVQAQYLKQASAAKDPLQAGSGFITPDGEYIQDPTDGRSKKIEFLMQQARQYETLAQSAETAQDRAAAQKAQNEIMNQIRLAQLEISRMNAGIAAANAGNAGNNRNQAQADKLRAEYTKRVDKIREGVGHAQTVSTLLTDPTIANDPTKQVSLVFAFGKMLDPESVVRESEYALIANARGLYDTLQQYIPMLQTGAKLSPTQLKSMQAIAQSMLNGSGGRVEALAEYYDDLANRRGLDPRDVLPSYTRPRSAPTTPSLPTPDAIAAEIARRQGAQK
jgi:hypothetical protein